MKQNPLQKKILQILCLVWGVLLFAGTGISAESAAAPATEPVGVEKININTAAPEELAKLEGIGPAYAQRIVEHRKTYGPFEKPEDIMNVKGIGPKTFERNKDRISI